VLEAVGKTIVHVGPAGSGQTVKAANQLIVAGNIELLAEAIVFLEAYGVDTEAVVAKPAVARPHPSHAHRGGVDMSAVSGLPGPTRTSGSGGRHEETGREQSRNRASCRPHHDVHVMDEAGPRPAARRRDTR
jgi:hypothetical protein